MSATKQPILQRVGHGGVALLVLFLILTLRPAAAQADAPCMMQASYEWSRAQQAAYDEYGREAQNINDKFSQDIALAFQERDAALRQRNIYGYTSRMNGAWRDLIDTLNRAASDYWQQQSACGPSYGTAPGYPYNDDPYQGYDYRSPYPTQSSPYGRYPYGSSNNNFYGQYSCHETPFQPLSPGCGYDCVQNRYGCQDCQVRCRNVRYDTSCICSDTWSPVCGKDNLTYTNACAATCSGVAVRYTGMCY